MSDWWIYKGTGKPHDGIDMLPDPPSWRKFRVSEDELIQFSAKQETTVQTEQHLGVDARGAKFFWLSIL